MNGLVPKDGSFSNVVVQKQITTPMVRATDVLVESSLVLGNGATIVSEPSSNGVIGSETMNAGTLNATTINTTTINTTTANNLITNTTGLNVLFVNLGITGASSPLSYYEALTTTLDFTSSMYTGAKTCTVNLTRIGNAVIATFQGFTVSVTGGAGILSATGLNSRFVPVADLTAVGWTIQGGGPSTGDSKMTIQTNGNVTIFGTVSGGNFSSILTVGIPTFSTSWNVT